MGIGKQRCNYKRQEKKLQKITHGYMKGTNSFDDEINNKNEVMTPTLQLTSKSFN